ncbi:hypothetical protein EXIGLDRAFT_765951 [Exidia glandulosa HHB12029]|uniref:Uncharacterized protein n=1 Tax=Exidia glandulosa HHB12029 TaxID=1314781 RepID=A0A165K3Y1_EXIGL|nr:hypothetical protein EXIGLDRAFT_765951 [Exidia glandulosa HHB12029]
MPGIFSSLFSRKKRSDSKTKPKSQTNAQAAQASAHTQTDEMDSEFPEPKRYGLEDFAPLRVPRVVAELEDELRRTFVQINQEEPTSKRLGAIVMDDPNVDIHKLQALHDMLQTRLAKMDNLVQQITAAGGPSVPSLSILIWCAKEQRIVQQFERTVMMLKLSKELKEGTRVMRAEMAEFERQKVADSKLYRVDVLPPMHVQQTLSFKELRAHMAAARLQK